MNKQYHIRTGTHLDDPQTPSRTIRIENNFVNNKIRFAAPHPTETPIKVNIYMFCNICENIGTCPIIILSFIFRCAKEQLK